MPPFLLMNGIGASLEVLQPFVDALDTRRTVIRFDVPGVGGSPRPVVPYRPGDVHARWWPACSTGWASSEPVDVLGLSWGGGLAQHFAVQHRQPVPAAGPRRNGDRHPDGAGAPAGAGEDAHAEAAPGPRVRAQHRRGDLRRHDAHRTPSGPRRRCTRRRGSVRGAGYYYQLAASSGWSSLPFLRLIRQPTLVVAGDDDPIIPVVNARIMARLIPDATLHVYAGGHIALVTEAHELAPVIEGFLDS